MSIEKEVTLPTEAAISNQSEKRSKLKSAKLWVTIWSCALVTYIVILNRVEFLEIARWLCAVPLAYIGFNVWQKKIQEDAKE